MNVAFLLHLYQPPTQSEHVFRQIYAASYYPLLKLLKNNHDYKFTLNIPLSLLEQMDKYGYQDWLKDIKDLFDNERIELVGSAAYHPLLTKIPEKLVFEQAILNEYSLGYYFGSKQGFEGEASILIKGIKGFFPPELALNESVLKNINDLGYEWVIGDKCAIPDLNGEQFSDNVFKYKDINTYVVVRDCEISNMLSFKRDGEIDDVFEAIHRKQQVNEGLVIALDGEAFGHHNAEGIYLIDSLIEKLLEFGINVTTVSEMVEECTKDKTDNIFESNWSEVVCSTEPAKLYKLWDNPDNKIQQALWKIQKVITAKYLELPELKDTEGVENVSLWNSKHASNLSKEVADRIDLNNMVNKSLHSDQFWWASNETIYGKVLYSPEMITKALDYYKEIAARFADDSIIKEVYDLSVTIEDLTAQK